MKTDVRLSTRFLTTQNAHQVGMLVSLTGETPVRRAPINVALVLDRSGSMSGVPLEAAKAAASGSPGSCRPRTGCRSWCSTTASTRSSGPRRRGRPPRRERSPGCMPAARPTCRAAGSRAGSWWRRGSSRAPTGSCCSPTARRTSGSWTRPSCSASPSRAPPSASAPPASASARTSTKTCSSRWPARARGNYWYVESDDQMAGIFEGEIEGLVALAAQNVEIEVRLTHPKVAGVSFLQSYPVTQTAEAAGRWRSTTSTRPRPWRWRSSSTSKMSASSARSRSARSGWRRMSSRGRDRAPDDCHARRGEPRRRGSGRAHGRADLPPLPGRPGARGSGAPRRQRRLRRAAACLRDAAVALSACPTRPVSPKRSRICARRRRSWT